LIAIALSVALVTGSNSIEPGVKLSEGLTTLPLVPEASVVTEGSVVGFVVVWEVSPQEASANIRNVVAKSKEITFFIL
jgi:hypothetical protein